MSIATSNDEYDANELLDVVLEIYLVLEALLRHLAAKE
ncbi:hypothetical protein CLAFUW4_11505 [Fulvia fulva]|nr:uncharacterized protein CLAFUR5_20316 [Fulvia fulva]KAK4620059.1 hypothetical protein CLAFUR4_11511 [Fulvia fulva]KAK4620354.1 hypothetical protein CLAFUR0_11519 [Fulvia fulva]WMI38964.1 hypothetical protein CLAFUR5_20316 [Fulvia fulva]WPV17035.1 hypothetical protein CLAFUW4_11505 [Fulvia fulva]WPV32177.1 hypothetical protein CLAFUW7_11510 [Fulvia fulva]